MHDVNTFGLNEMHDVNISGEHQAAAYSCCHKGY